MTLISNHQLHKAATSKISNGFKGKSIVAFVDLLGFSKDIMSKWDNKTDDPLYRLMRIKSLLELAIKNANPHKFCDHNGKIILKITYPKLITFSDSFIFLKELEDQDPSYILGSVLATIGSIIELWRISVDEKFSIRGGVDYGEIFYTVDDLVGPTLINSYNLEVKTADVSRILISKTISNIISENIGKINPVLMEYFRRYFMHDFDNRISLNPLIAFGYNNKIEVNRNKQKFIEIRDKSNKYRERRKISHVIKLLEKGDTSLLPTNLYSSSSGPSFGWYIKKCFYFLTAAIKKYLSENARI